MSYRISLWIEVIGIAATISFIGTISVTKTSFAQPLLGRIEIDNTTRSRAILIVQKPLPKANSYLVSGGQKYERGDYQGALSDYTRAIQLDPNNAFVYIYRGVMRADNLNDIQGGLADLNRATQIDPQNAFVYNARGTVKSIKLQDDRGGLADFDRAIQLNPNFASAYGNRGYLRANKTLPDNQGALADYDLAIQLDPNNAFVYGNRGLLKHDRLNDRSSGITDLQQAAKLYQQQGSIDNSQRAIKQLKKWQQDRKNSNL